MKVRDMGGLGGRVISVVVCVLACLWHCDLVFAAGDANLAGCPLETESSPGFDSTLPDCRAYELVSPAFAGDAIAAGVENFAPPMSGNGEHLLGVSFGAFAGTEDLPETGTEYGAVYEFSRTPSGWSAEAQDPPASLYPRRILTPHGISSAALGRSVWLVEVAAHPGEEEYAGLGEHAWVDGGNVGFVVREPMSGGKASFRILGPASAPGHEEFPHFIHEAEPGVVAGVSADVTHVVFEVKDQSKELWPGDSTVGGGSAESLYEYGLSGGEPVLVGVRDRGGLHGVPHVNEGAVLVSDCGTGFDAISASGERVVFTARHVEGCTGSQPAVSEVYARVDSSQTVDISEPTTGPVGDCESCDESEPMEASFVGASEDGSKVFFTSEQKLLAGAAGNSLYEYDFNAPHPGQRVTLIAPDVTGVEQVAKDGERVYFESERELTGVANGNDEKAVEGTSSVYVYDTDSGSLAFVVPGEEAGAFDATRSGAFVVFKSADRYMRGAEDSSIVAQLFEYDAANGSVVRVSIGQYASTGYWCEAAGKVEEGYDCEGNTTEEEDAPRMVGAPNSSVAENGTVVFTSELPLTPQAVQGRSVEYGPFDKSSFLEDVYEFRGGQVYLLSVGNEATPAHYEGEQPVVRLFGIDESGRDVFFSSVDSLVRQDTDTQSSWYDAREDGGFSEPSGSAGCVGEACQGAVAPAPVLPAVLAPPAFNENLVPPPAVVKLNSKAKRCKKGFVRKKGKCVKAPRRDRNSSGRGK
jgi:hypothetical protein